MLETRATDWSPPASEPVQLRAIILVSTRVMGALAAGVGVAGLTAAPFVGSRMFDKLWGIEPLTYIGLMSIMAGLILICISLMVSKPKADAESEALADGPGIETWSQITQQYFELFDHDLGRPLRRILGKERELRAVLGVSAQTAEPAVKELLDEIERQAPNFRLMMSNIRVLVQLEAPGQSGQAQPVEPSEIIRRIVDRYTPVATEEAKEVTWWSEPSEFGIVYSDSSAIEHIVTNLVDNAVRFATTHVEVKITKNPTHFFVRVWDDGPGIPPQHIRHIFDRGWTPAVARREEKTSSGLGLFIARTLARRYNGDLTVESVTKPDPDHHTAFLLSLPLRSL